MDHQAKDQYETAAPTEPAFPVNLTSWRHYTPMRLLAVVTLAYSLLCFAETAYVTTVRIGEIRAEARDEVLRRNPLERMWDGATGLWCGRPSDDALVARKTGALISGRRIRSAAGVGLAWLLVWLTFGHRPRSGGDCAAAEEARNRGARQ